MGKYLAMLMMLFFMVKCGVDTPEPGPDVKPPIIVSGNINVFPTSIKAGETVTISWSDLVNVKTLMINNTLISISDGSKTYTPTTTTTFSINLIGTNDKVIEKSAVVNVVEPPVVVVIVPTKLDTMIALICLAPFIPFKVEEEFDNGVWDEQTMNEVEARKVWAFYKDGKYTRIDPLGIGLNIEGDWNFSSDLRSLTYGGRTDSIITLDKDKIILGFWYQKYNPVTKDYDINWHRGKRTYLRK